jgi:L-lactate dehydrogenase complex protein LldG
VSRDTILQAIRQRTATMEPVTLPQTPTPNWSTSESDIQAFIQAVESVGGTCIDTPQHPTLNTKRSTLNPQLSTLAPSLFPDKEVTFLDAHFGVIENGACWIVHDPAADRTRYTLSEHLAILLPRTALVATMHEAYARIAELGIEDFGLFLSGPSKTADIEQALVIGAQGAVSTTVFLV